MRVLLVDDSRSLQAYVGGLLAAEPDLELLPPVADGAQAVEAAAEQGPDVVLMDLQLPGIDGLEAIRRIMARRPLPIVVLSGELDHPGRDLSWEALAAGAVEVLAKPRGLAPPVREAFRRQLLRTVRLMARVRVVRRSARREGPAPVGVSNAGRPLDLLAIGVSTGGPALLRALLDAAPPPFPLPVVVAQHVAAGFEEGLCRWLAGSGHPVRLARGGERLAAGDVLLAPATAHLVLAGPGLTALEPPATPDELTPSADRLLASAARWHGARAAGAVLTGMGSDGAEGLRTLRRAGGLTVAQEPASCVIASMPERAIALGGAELVLPPSGLLELLHRGTGE